MLYVSGPECLSFHAGIDSCHLVWTLVIGRSHVCASVESGVGRLLIKTCMKNRGKVLAEAGHEEEIIYAHVGTLLSASILIKYFLRLKYTELWPP